MFKKAPKRITNFRKKKMKLLTNEHQKSYEKAKMCCNCWEIFGDKYANDKSKRLLKLYM